MSWQIALAGSLAHKPPHCAATRSSLLMLPNSATGKRTIQVAAGTSHSRTIDMPADPNNVPVVERMTRSRLDKMSASQVAKWRNESIKAIQDLSPRKSERDGVITQFFERRHTHEAPSPLKAKSPLEAKSPDPGPRTPHDPEKKRSLSSKKRDRKRSMKKLVSGTALFMHAPPSPCDASCSYIA